MLATFKDDEEIIDLVRRFESCEINPADFRHYQHLTVALWYIKEFPYDIASDKLRAGIKQLAAAYGKTGYHETITVMWIRLLDGLKRASEPMKRAEFAARSRAQLQNLDHVTEHRVAELGFEPGALGGHDAAGVGDGHQVLDARREHAERTGVFAAVHEFLQLRRATDAADEVDLLARARIGDAEDRVEHELLEQRYVELLNRVVCGGELWT